MPGRRLSNDKRWKVLTHYLAGDSYGDIERWLEVSRSTVDRVVEQFEAEGTVDQEYTGIRGRPTLLSPGDVVDLLELFQQNASLKVRQLQLHLDLKGTHVSRSTLLSTLHSLHLSRKQLTKQASQADPALRLEYTAFMSTTFSPQHIVYVDESGYDDDNCSPTHGWSEEGKPAFFELPFRPGKRVSLLAALSLQGFECGRLVKETVDAREFFDWASSDLVLFFPAVVSLLCSFPLRSSPPRTHGLNHARLSSSITLPSTTIRFSATSSMTAVRSPPLLPSHPPLTAPFMRRSPCRLPPTLLTGVKCD